MKKAVPAQQRIHTAWAWIFLCAVCCTPAVRAQELSGYLSGMPAIIVQQPGGEAWNLSQLHNRLNFDWRPAGAWRLEAAMRTRFLWGSEAMVQPEGIGFDAGNVGLSWNMDRLSVTFERGKWQMKLGRQRINWGQTFVWNPNDLFNQYSFFDFDYPERAGCDALRVTCFHSGTASSELAASLNADGRLTAALLHHWNWRNFDWQLISGFHTPVSKAPVTGVGEPAETDLVLGGAWTGDFGGLNFRGEMSFFRPLKRFSDTAITVAASIGADYLFSNSLMLQAEVLYNNAGDGLSGDGLLSLYAAPLSARKLSVCSWNLFGQASYPVTSRLNVSLSGMSFVDINAAYAGLSADYSLLENLDMSCIVQFFASAAGSNRQSDMQIWLGFARLKYSF
jgi:hypothetical protein